MCSKSAIPPSSKILGIRVDALTLPLAVEIIAGWIEARTSHYVCVTPAHAIMDYRRDPDLMRIANQSGLTTPDGMSLVWLLRRRGHPQVERVYGPDLLLTACETGLNLGWRHFFYGGAPGVAEKLAAELQARFAGLQVAGTHTPPFRPLTPQEDADVTGIIQTAKPDIVWVGLSSPKQERWMAAHVDRLQVPALIGVGAAFDFISGTKPQAPRWIQHLGMEWLFRLASEPRRLWRRYAEYPYFGWLIAKQMWATRDQQAFRDEAQNGDNR